MSALFQTPVIEHSEPNFRKGSEAEIQKLRHYGLAEGISRSTWYRRCKAAREREALAAAAARSQAMFERAEALAATARPRSRKVRAGECGHGGGSLRAHDRGEKRPDNFCCRTMAAIGDQMKFKLTLLA